MLLPVLRRSQGLGRFRDEMDDLFHRFFADWPLRSMELGNDWPALDVSETNEAIVVRAELPGMKAEDINISVQGGALSISGEKKEEHEERKEGEYYHSERRYGQFQRVVTLPNDVDAEKIAATQRDGVLTVTLPKSETAKPKRIAVKDK